MDRGDDDERVRDDSRAGLGRAPGAQGRDLPGPGREPGRERPGEHRAQDERDRNQRAEVRESDKADLRRLSPYSTEQRMMGVLAELGERYRLDYEREYKIRDEPNDWYVTHVDFAWPADGLVIRFTARSIATRSSTRPAREPRTTGSASRRCRPAAGGCWSSTTRSWRGRGGARPWPRSRDSWTRAAARDPDRRRARD